jgi:glycogen debranching enzyme
MSPEELRACEFPASSDAQKLVRAHGSLFVVTDVVGDIAPPGARDRGLFFEDTRFLSKYTLCVHGAEVVRLSNETSNDVYNQVDLMLSSPEERDVLDDPENYLHIRRRQLVDRSFLEEIWFTNFLAHEVALEVSIGFDSDFADIFEVRGAKRPRRGERLPPLIGADAVELGYDGLDGRHYGVHLSFKPPPRALEANPAHFLFNIPRGESRILTVEARPCCIKAPTRSFAPSAQRVREGVEAFRWSSASVRCDNIVLERALEQAVTDLFALQLSVGGNRIIAAGTPWFSCPFGRDALLTSYSALMLNPSLAEQSLRTLAAFQGKVDRSDTEEEPGKILHELRFGEMVFAKEIPHAPYYGSIDATPLFVIVADALLKVTADLRVALELEPAVRAALAWIDRRTCNGTAFLTYEKRSPRGLDNQGWKDSRAGVSHPDGRRALPPIALCEVQGYCVDAYRRGARFLGAMGDVELASTYSARAEAMAGHFEEGFWLPELERYAYAIDGRGEKLQTVVSNFGHLLWSRVPSAERAREIGALLTSPASFSGFGVRTLASGQAVYNPLSYHNGTVWPHDNAIIAKGLANYGLAHPASRIFEGMVSALEQFRDRRLPELFCGLPPDGGGLVPYPVACSPQAWASAAPFLLLQAALGLHIDGRARTLTIHNPTLPPSVRQLEIERLRIANSLVSLGFRREDSHCHVYRLEVTGDALRTEISLDLREQL